MTWLEDLSAELSALAVPRRRRSRIIHELRDHIDCEPGCEPRLGDPRELATTFADELATDGARRAAFEAFGALATVAVALVASQLTIRLAGGYAGFTQGLSPFLFWPALIGMLVAPQAALVAGTLGALRALRRRRAPVLPAAEVALISRRVAIAVTAGWATLGGLGLYMLDFSSILAGWWLVFTGALTVIGAGAMLTATTGLARTATIVSGAPGAAGDIYDDLPLPRWHWLQGRPWRLGTIVSMIAALALTALAAHAEHSIAEGIQRGAFEGLAAALGFALLGRAIGVRRGTSDHRRLPATTPMHLASDADRATAELILRDGFVCGQLNLEELDERIAAVHCARTVAQLRDVLSGLGAAPPLA